MVLQRYVGVDVKARTFLVSDWHFHHANFVRGGTIAIRDQFVNVQQMNDYIVECHNRTVAPQDTVYCLGDVTLSRDFADLGIVSSLNGRKILLRGNHDHQPEVAYLAAGFAEVIHYLKLHGCVLSHIPLHPSQFYRFKGNIHGHTHEAPDLPGPYLNVCVEPLLYTPITLEDAVARIEDKRAAYEG